MWSDATANEMTGDSSERLKRNGYGDEKGRADTIRRCELTGPQHVPRTEKARAIAGEQ